MNHDVENALVLAAHEAVEALRHEATPANRAHARAALDQALRDFSVSIASAKQATPDFDGPSYDPENDRDRLMHQLGRVYDCMKDSTWRTLEEIHARTLDPVASISAQSGTCARRGSAAIASSAATGATRGAGSTSIACSRRPTASCTRSRPSRTSRVSPTSSSSGRFCEGEDSEEVAEGPALRQAEEGPRVPRVERVAGDLYRPRRQGMPPVRVVGACTGAATSRGSPGGERETRRRVPGGAVHESLHMSRVCTVR